MTIAQYDQCEAMAGGTSKNAQGWRCLRRAVGSFETHIHDEPMRLCNQHAGKYATKATPKSALADAKGEK